MTPSHPEGVIVFPGASTSAKIGLVEERQRIGMTKERTFETGGEVLRVGSKVVVFDGNSQRELAITDIGTKRVFIESPYGFKPVPYSKEDRSSQQGAYSSYFRTKTEVAQEQVRAMVKARLRDLGIEARMVDSSDPASFATAIDQDTRFLYLESVGNPKGNVDDIPEIARVARAHGLPLVIDNTMCPPPIFNPFAHGADLVVYSLTKMIGGHGTSVGGAVVEKGDFDWTQQGRFPELTEPDPAYHGVNFWEAFGDHENAVARGRAFTVKMRSGVLRDLGACLSPFNSFLFLQGLETLPLRAARHCENALAVAQFLESHPAVAWVNYAGLPSHPDFARARRLMPLGPSAVFGFGIKGGLEAGKRFIRSVKLCSHLANILDAKTLVIHPASTTHQQLTEEERLAGGVTPDFIRLSVGLESVADITADLDQALRVAVKG